MEQTPVVEAPVAGAGPVLSAPRDVLLERVAAPATMSTVSDVTPAPGDTTEPAAPADAAASSASPAGVVRAVVSLLAGVEPEGVCEGERVEAIAALEELKGAASAAQARLTAAVVTDREALGEDTTSIRAEVALARRCSPSVADRHVGSRKHSPARCRTRWPRSPRVRSVSGAPRSWSGRPPV